MESQAFHGFGSLLKVGDGASPEVFTTIAELNSISFGALSTAVIDKTHHESPNDHREKMPGLKDTGAFGFAGNYIPGNATQKNAGRGLLALWKNRTVANFKIVLSDDDATEWPFTGFISSLQVGEVGIDEKVAISGEATPTGEPTLP